MDDYPFKRLLSKPSGGTIPGSVPRKTELQLRLSGRQFSVSGVYVRGLASLLFGLHICRFGKDYFGRIGSGGSTFYVSVAAHVFSPSRQRNGHIRLHFYPVLGL